MIHFLRILNNQLEDNSDENISEQKDDSVQPIKCEMIGTFGNIVQLALGVVSFGVLIIKRLCENPRRPWKVWALDLSKQAFATTSTHFLNLFLAIFLSTPDADECALYFINTFMDCTVGVLFTYVIMKVIDCFAKSNGLTNIQSGLYYDIIEYEGKEKKVQIKIKMYLAQLGVWMVATVIIKICMIVCQIFTEKLLNKFANLILNPFNFDGRIKLLMVMVILPFFLDAFYYWMVDNILKLHPENEPKIIKKKQYIEMPQSLDTDDVSKVGKDENKLEPQKVEIQDSSMIKNEVKLDDSSISK